MAEPVDGPVGVGLDDEARVGEVAEDRAGALGVGVESVDGEDLGGELGVPWHLGPAVGDLRAEEGAAVGGEGEDGVAEVVAQVLADRVAGDLAELEPAQRASTLLRRADLLGGHELLVEGGELALLLEALQEALLGVVAQEMAPLVVEEEGLAVLRVALPQSLPSFLVQGQLQPRDDRRGDLLLELLQVEGLRPALVALAGLALTAALMARRIPGALLWGILASTVIGASLGIVEYQGIFSAPPSIRPTLLRLDVAGALAPGMIAVVLVFFLLALFDSVGTLVGVGQQAGLMRNGTLPRARQARVQA